MLYNKKVWERFLVNAVKWDKYERDKNGLESNFNAMAIDDHDIFWSHQCWSWNMNMKTHHINSWDSEMLPLEYYYGGYVTGLMDIKELQQEWLIIESINFENSYRIV